MKEYNKVILFLHDKNWADHFKQEINSILALFGNSIVEAHHIGSTAIPGMPAKPIVDIILEFDNLNALEDIAIKLQMLGYSQLGRNVIPYHSYFTYKYDEKIGFHLHIFERGDPQIKRHVNFRDFIITHKGYLKLYADLKLELAEKFHDNRKAYVLAKSKLVQQIDAQAKVWAGRRKSFFAAYTGLPAKEWSQEKIIRAFESNINVALTHFAQYLNQIDFIRKPGITLVNSHLPDYTFNYILDADFTIPETRSYINEISNYFIKENIPFSWLLNTHEIPEDLSENLKKDYPKICTNTTTYFDLDVWDDNFTSPAGLEIVLANNKNTLNDFASVLPNDEFSFKQYFSWVASILTGDDPIEYYVGYINNKPVVRGLSCYYAGIAGLYFNATTLGQEAGIQNQDYAAAMQNIRLRRAKNLGYHLAFVAQELVCQ